ncbi:MAG TPA: FAD-dependent monooxygenase [Acetobacteraceae bacterium]|nr:FAD-dependent monooxygenase [Acetobacteraceae bacterium]
MRRAPPLIIGGGPAGAAAAIALARAGHAPTLIERTTRPTDKVCGDFLSAEAIQTLIGHGIDFDALAPAPITSIRLVHRHRVATTRLPFAAYGLTRRVLDEALMQQASACGADVRRGHTARRIAAVGSSLRIDCDAAEAIEAKAVFLATGKHDLRGAPRRTGRTGLVGLKMYYALDSRQADCLRDHIELALFPGGYAGLQPVEGGQAVLCALLPAATLRENGRSCPLATLIDASSHLTERLSGARALLDRPLAVAGMPYGYVHTPRYDDLPGVFRLGDQAAVIGSCTGDGVALALASGATAADSWRTGGTAASYHRGRRRQLARQIGLAQLIHGLCLSGRFQPSIAAACRAFPHVMAWAANWTRSGTITELSV